MEIEGLVLQAIPFGEHDRILTLFTEDAILKLFVKGRRRMDGQLLALTSPFTVALYTYRKTKSDLGRFQEGRLIDQNLKLRDRLSSFETAQKILATLLATQWQNKPAPALYQLAKRFLQEIPQQEGLYAPFLLKLLKHEGILDSAAFEEKRQIEAIAKARTFEALKTVLPDEELAQKIEEYFHASLEMPYCKVICPSVTSM